MARSLRGDARERARFDASLDSAVSTARERHIQRRKTSGLGELITDKGRMVPGGRAYRAWGGGSDVPLKKRILAVPEIRDAGYLHDPDAFISEFHLRSVEFGHWLNETERRTYLYGAAQGLADLAKVLGRTHEEMGMGGRLSIALGARGNGGGAAAHYEGEPHAIINLAKSGEYERGTVDAHLGRQSLAHEYGHALDNLAAVLLGMPKKEGLAPWLSGGRSQRHTPDPDVMRGSGLRALMERFFDKLYWEDEQTPTELGDDLADLKGYWNRREETWARSFETWISHLMGDRPVGWLVKPASSYLRRMNGFRVYPSSEQIRELTPKFKEITDGAFELFGRRALKSRKPAGKPAGAAQEPPEGEGTAPTPPKPRKLLTEPSDARPADKDAGARWIARAVAGAIANGQQGSSVFEEKLVADDQRDVVAWVRSVAKPDNMLVDGKAQSVLFPDLPFDGHTIDVVFELKGKGKGTTRVYMRAIAPGEPEPDPKPAPEPKPRKPRKPKPAEPEPDPEPEPEDQSIDAYKERDREWTARAYEAIQAHLKRGGQVPVVTAWRTTWLRGADRVRLSKSGEVQARLGRADKWVWILHDQLRVMAKHAGFKEPQPWEADANTDDPEPAPAPPPGPDPTPAPKVDSAPKSSKRSDRRVLHGRSTTVETATESIPARYALVAAEDLIPSHDPRTWSKDPRYPASCQQRDYTHDKAEQAKVRAIASGFKPEFFLADSPTAVDGSPIVNVDGIVLGGNGRTMGLWLLDKAGRKRYEDALADVASRFGFTEEQVRSFDGDAVLIREVDVDMGSCAIYSNILNTSLTQAVDITTQTISYSRQLSPAAIEMLAEIFEQAETDTIAEALSDRRTAEKVLHVFRQAGIITPQTTSQWVDPATHALSDQGRLVVPKILIGTVLPDKRLIDTARSYTDQLVQTVPLLIRMQKLPPEWSLIDAIQDAIRAESERRASGTPKADFLAQDSFVRPDISERVRLVWDALDGGRRRFKAFIESYVTAAERESALSEGGFGFDTPMDPAETLRKVAGKTPGALGDELPAADELPPEEEHRGVRLLTLRDIWRMRHTPFPWSPRWRGFFGNLGHQFRMIFWGPPGSGKSTLALALAEELSRQGSVLYVATEEAPEAGGFRQRMMLTRAGSSRITVADNPTLEEIAELAGTGDYRWIFIDSVNSLVETGQTTMADVIRMTKRYPRVSWIHVMHSNADEKRLKGGTAIEHDVDVVVTVKDGVASTSPRKNRMGPPATMRVFV